MKSEEAKEGLAKVALDGKGRTLEQYIRDEVKKLTAPILQTLREIEKERNSLLRRAELAERMARVLYEASARCFCTKRWIEKGHRPECATPDIERVLAEWGAINGKEVLRSWEETKDA